MNLDDHLRRHLADEAAALEPSPEDLAGVQRRARQRRRHAGLAGAFGVVALLAVGAIGYFAIFGDEESDNIETAPVTQSDDGSTDDGSTEDGSAPEPDEQGESEPPVEPQPAALEEPIDVREVSGPAWELGSEGDFAPQWLVPWRDGFLSISYALEPVPFPELTDEQRALFPQEVLDIFEDSPAESVQDAYNRVGEAGLSEEALAVLEEYPELGQLITGAQGTSVFEAWFTVDGSSWEPVEGTFAPPIDDYPSRVVSNGESLVIASELFDPIQGEPLGVQVASTADLQNWDLETVQATLPEVPDWAESGFWLSSLVVGTDGWAASLTADIFADPMGLLPLDTQEELMMTNLSAWSDDQGVHVQRTDCGETGPCDDVGEELVYSWEELGVDQATFEQYEPGNTNTRLVTRPWSGELAIQEIPDAHSHNLAMTDVGTVAVVEHNNGRGASRTEVLFSSDWSTWTSLPLPAVDLGPGVTVWGLPDGILLDSSTEMFVGTADGSEWTAVSIPSVSTQVSGAFPGAMFQDTGSSGGLAMIVDMANYREPDYEPVEFTVEADGYSLYSFEDPADGSAVITVTDLDTGDEVVSLTVNMFSGFEPEGVLEFERDGSVRILDAETGAIIVTFPGSEIMEVRDAIWAEREPPDMVWPDPEPAVVATRDGYSWLVEPLGIDPNSDAFWMATAAMNGNRVLVDTGTGYRLYELD